MKPRQLEAFRAVMMMGSITAGADHLRLSQPAVTRLIRDLERSLDLSLFERERGRVRPTSAALALVREIDRCFVGWDRIAKTAADIRQGRKGRLRIAAIPALAVGVLPEILARFLADRPRLSVDVMDGSALEIAEWIADGAYDLGFATTAATHSSVQIHTLPPVRAVAVLAPDHRLARHSAVRPADLAGELLIAPYRSTRLRARLEDALARAGVEMQPRIETSLSAVAGAVAAAGGGVAIVEAFTAELLKGTGAVVRPFRDGLEIDYAVLTPAERRLSAAAEAFLKAALQAFGRPRRQRRPAARRTGRSRQPVDEGVLL
jgi:DNA-binding transcriptional LysR family regulator